jgi:hypothetical protein
MDKNSFIALAPESSYSKDSNITFTIFAASKLVKLSMKMLNLKYLDGRVWYTAHGFNPPKGGRGGGVGG